MDEFSLDHLTPTDFENFCFDLLQAVGFEDLDWRKGSAGPSTTSDFGRDIECTRIRHDPDGSRVTEKWFVEAKRHKGSVSAHTLNSALSWAQAERPDVLLFIVSSWLSNAAKEYLETYRRNNSPIFRIKTWEKPALEQAILPHPALTLKYRTGGHFGFIHYMHPNHLLYLRHYNGNTLDFLFETLDGLDHRVRDSVLSTAYHAFVRIETKPIDDPDRPLKEYITSSHDHEAFKGQCYRLAQSINEFALVFSIVSFSLYSHFHLADPTNISEVMERRRDAVRALDEDILSVGGADAKSLEALREKMSRSAEEYRDEASRHMKEYSEFCDYVIPRLLAERAITGD